MRLLQLKLLLVRRVLSIFYYFRKICFQFIDKHLESLNTSRKFDRSVSICLFDALPKSILNTNLVGLLNRPIEFKDLVEIIMNVNIESENAKIKKASIQLYFAAHNESGDNFPLNYFERDVWLSKALDRIILVSGEILPYSAEIYLNRLGAIYYRDFFTKICQCEPSYNPDLVIMLVTRYLKRHHSLFSKVSEFIRIAESFKNVPVLKIVVNWAPYELLKPSFKILIK